METCYEKFSAATNGVAGADSDAKPADCVSLAFAERTKSRGKAASDKGTPVAWFLPRGYFLVDGDVLKSENGQFFQVRAAPETVSRATADSRLLLLRAAYHLGNRHVPLQVLADSLCYQVDHVLDEMVRQLGLTVERCEQSFQPEDGAYRGGHAAGDHDHSHHDHSHSDHSHSDHLHNNDESVDHSH